MSRNRWIAGGVAAAAVLGGFALNGSDPYDVQMVMPSAAQLSTATPVWIDGRQVGQVSDLGLKDGQALVKLELDDDVAPLHAGTTSRVEWVSAVGERVLTLYPGKPSNAEIPEGSYLKSASSQVEVDEVLQALDADTRARLNSLITRLRQTVEGREAEVNDTIKQASGTVDALGDVMRAVGEDGPAIRAIVTDLADLLKSSSERRSKISSTVTDLSAVATAVSKEQKAISSMLSQLPGTLDAASTTLGKVPGASDETVALLGELEPSTQRLRSVSRNLAPVLVDLRPTVAELRPLLGAAQDLLALTPGLLDSSHQVLPQVTQLLDGLAPAISFIRPYTPDGIGGLHNWGQAFAPYDGAGHTWAGLLAPGTSALNESLVPLPTARQNPEPDPGQAGGQPWVDANGSEIR